MWIILLSCLAFADDNVVTLEKGDIAPFSGTLLSPTAAAKLLAESESDLQTCLAKAKLEKDNILAEKKYAVATKEAELAACTLRYEKTSEVYEEQIKYLSNKAVTPDWKGPVVFSGGVLTGIAVMLGSAWILDKIND